MKLLRYGPPGGEKPGLLDRDGKIRDLSGAVKDIDGAALSPASLAKLRAIDPASLPLVSGTPRLGPCVGGVSKVLAIGLNYRLHAQEAGMPIPSEPIFFLKATSSICGPKIVSYCSHFMTLYPGDVVPTGTPSGVAMGFKPPRFLKAGDRMRLSVEGLGAQEQRLVAYQG
jgi:2-keto-4-pentenoate hydratase/2-oxohepta-3-ene-1,7-dioic acid hydratase in catechol pathway